MTQIVKFQVAHLQDLRELQRYQTGDMLVHADDACDFEMFEKGVGMAFSALDRDGLAWACAGVFTIWPGRAQAWMLAAEGWDTRVAPHTIFGFCRRILDAYPADRVEATVVVDFDAGHRWLQRLGFEQEAHVMRKYDPAGRDVSLYARVRA